jgi:hypothetical protein
MAGCAAATPVGAAVRGARAWMTICSAAADAAMNVKTARAVAIRFMKHLALSGKARTAADLVHVLSKR